MGALKSIRCARGHRFTKANTLLRKNGQRECRECKRIRYQQRLERLAQAERAA